MDELLEKAAEEAAERMEAVTPALPVRRARRSPLTTVECSLLARPICRATASVELCVPLTRDVRSICPRTRSAQIGAKRPA